MPRPKLLRSLDLHKDQTYYLSSVKEDALRQVGIQFSPSEALKLNVALQALFPIGHLDKRTIRTLAKKYDLPTATRPESMGICFVGEKGRFEDFLG